MVADLETPDYPELSFSRAGRQSAWARNRAIKWVVRGCKRWSCQDLCRKGDIIIKGRARGAEDRGPRGGGGLSNVRIGEGKCVAVVEAGWDAWDD